MHDPLADLRALAAIGQEPYVPKGNNPISWLERGINYDDYLIGEGFIEKGTASLLAGPSGIGKSSIAMQKAVLWAIGKPAFDLPPCRPLRIMLTQTEDSDNDIVKQLALIDALGLSQIERKTLAQNLWIEPLLGKTGSTAIQAWAELCKWFKADLLMVNPLSAYHDGDISSNQDNQSFLYSHLGGLLSELRIGFDSIHHKTKPNQNRKNVPYHEKMYDMLGGSVLTNFHRAIMLVDPVGESEIYNFTVAKRFTESLWTTKTQMFKWHENKLNRLWIHAPLADSQLASSKANSRAHLYSLVPPLEPILKSSLELCACQKSFTQRCFRAVLAECLLASTPDNERLYVHLVKNQLGGPKKFIARFPQP